ncbi:NAD(P)-binding protein [Nocardia huaxiensis]|uniref:NAD(P)-binding protein n=1 Tax=Nocardia huaxiensis TaxID=2755382 RepID=UPI001E466FED|nr:NAD(P)-binding protein [Nocardia huaxiensis]UFS97062.1 NAD-binding protein [Nocardia huaxiensis]
MSEHWIVIGYGRTGRALTHTLSGSFGLPSVTVIDPDIDHLIAAWDDGAVARVGTGCPEMLELAGIASARTVIITLDDDDEVVPLIGLARRLNADCPIYAAINEPARRQEALDAGANTVVGPNEDLDLPHHAEVR